MLNSTGNTLNLGGGLPWSGTVTGAAGGYSGGSTPAYNPNTGNIIFGYTKSTVSQMVAINQALETAGTGIQLSGYKYSWNINNDLNNSGGNRGIVYGNVSLKGPNGNVLESFNYDYSTRNLPGFTTFSGTQLFENRYSLSAVDNLTVSFTGKDQNFWAGYYGPRVHVNDLSLLYTTKPVPVVVDPCIADPLSSPTCPGYALATVKNSILGSTVSNASATSFVPAINYGSPAPAAAPPGVADAAPALAQASPQQQAQQPPPQQQSPQPQQPGQDPNQNPAVAQDNPAQPSPQQAGPAPTSPQPAGGPPQATQTAQSAPPPSAGPSQAGPQQAGPATSGSGPSKLAMSVVKSAQDKDKTTQAQAVQNAAKAFETTQQTSQAASNFAVSMNQDMSANSAAAAANFASQTTQASTQVATQSSQTTQQSQQANSQQQQSNKSTQLTQQTQETQQAQQQHTSSSLVQLQPPQQATQQAESQPIVTAKTQAPQVQETQQTQTQTTASVSQVQPPVYTPPAQQETQSTSVVVLKPPTPTATETQPQTSSGTGLTVGRNLFAYNPLVSINTASISTAPAQTAPMYQPKLQERVMEAEAPQMQVASFGGMGKAGNPLSEMIMQQRFELMQENIQQQNSTVNRNVQPNDLAGGVDLTAMATVPQGFNAYSVVLRDAAFYEPKEVYKNQKTVDNVRLLRGLTGGSDALHQQMIDQQYK